MSGGGFLAFASLPTLETSGRGYFCQRLGTTWRKINLSLLEMITEPEEVIEEKELLLLQHMALDLKRVLKGGCYLETVRTSWMIGIPWRCRSFLSPNPDSSSSFGELIAPAESITSFRA